MDQALWQKCIDFHGHECGGLAIGYRAAEIAQETLGLDFSNDEEVVCVTENDACGVDAIQVVTGCTMGKGNLLYRKTGKQAFSFFKRSDGTNLRLIQKPNREMSRDEKKLHILYSSPTEVFDFKKPDFVLPEKARIFQTIVCESCGEGAPEHTIRLENGKKLCTDCAHRYTRGW